MDKYFIITLDVEGDNMWAVSDIKAPVSTENAKYLFRFQELCEKYNFIPTYLVNYEMALDKAMIELGRAGIKNSKLEIGMHMHAWNCPPYFPLIKAPVKRGKPYMSEYPRFAIERKITYLTELLQDTFQVKMRAHRGGRWCLDDRIIAALEKNGYTVDCTCTPKRSWKKQPGWTIGSGGTDWSQLESRPYMIMEKGKNVLVEIPVTAASKKPDNVPACFRPNGRNGKELIAMIDYIYPHFDYIEFMIHSSELMASGSPTFRNKGQIERLYADMEDLFKELSGKGYIGIGISDFADIIKNKGDMGSENSDSGGTNNNCGSDRSLDWSSYAWQAI